VGQAAGRFRLPRDSANQALYGREVGLISDSAIEWRAIAFLLLAAAGVAGVLALHQVIRARRARFFILARHATRKARRRLTTTTLLLVGAALVAIVEPDIPVPELATPSPTSDEARPEPTATRDALPAAPTASPTPTPTTPTPSASPTPAVPPPDIALTPIPGALPARDEARIELAALAMEKSEAGRPVDPATTFPEGQHALYLFFTYSGLENGVPRTFAWYKEGEFWPRCSDTDLWAWGPRGATWFFCWPSDGWQPGDYEIRVFVDARLQGIAGFTIAGD